jgi:Arc/MetJ-type ribon-helix-helix transcriptional regulator
MPVTSFDLPHDILDFLDQLVHDGFARNRREIVVRALQAYSKFQIHRWNDSLIIINGIRKGLVSKGSLMELTSEMSDRQLLEAGTRMGKALRDSAKGRNLDISLPENHKAALQMLEDFGWGGFKIEGNRITIIEPLVPAPLMHGYLEAALGTALTRLDSVEEILFFEIMQLPLASETQSISVRNSQK